MAQATSSRAGRSTRTTAWTDAYEALVRADGAEPLGAQDLERLATAAFMLGRDDDYLALHERAHHAYLAAGDVPNAVRCAFWIGMNLVLRGEIGPGQRLARAGATAARSPWRRVRRAWIHADATHLPAGGRRRLRRRGRGRHRDRRDRGTVRRCRCPRSRPPRSGPDGDQDGSGQGRPRSPRRGDGRGDRGGAVAAGHGRRVLRRDPCPQEVYEVRRAREWTAALTRWCAGQPDLKAFTGRCLVHRAEILQLQGSWRDALEEAQRAGERFAETRNSPGPAWPSTGRPSCSASSGSSTLRRRHIARRAGTDGSRSRGWRQLRLAQGRVKAALSTIRRVLGEATEPLKRAGLLPAYVEIMLAAGDLTRPAARAASSRRSLRGTRARCWARWSRTHAARSARAEVTRRRPRRIRGRRRQVWQELEAPYDVARARVLVGLACRELGDEDAATLELEAARSAFERLGAAPDLARLGRSSARLRRRPARADAARGRGAPSPGRRQEQSRDRRRRS